jgi:NHL repeat
VVTSAQLQYPFGVALDSLWNICIADSNNNRIRLVTTSTGVITTVAGSKALLSFDNYGDGGQATSAILSLPVSVAVDASGNIFIADNYHQLVRLVTTSTGIITTVAGARVSNRGEKADQQPQLDSEQWLELLLTHRVTFSSLTSFDRTIRKSTGIINTVTGNGAGFSGDGGQATSAKLYAPQKLAIDASGDLFVADTSNYRIRMIA